MNHPNLKKETRYGVPAADQILYNRHYVLGYSFYFRQAKWALELIDPDRTDVVRLNNFRTDFRIPDPFRADKDVYVGSGLERGHLVASANQIETSIQNSETFLLSNMCPQIPEFNGGVWSRLEEAIRIKDSEENVYETYVISGPLFYFDQEVVMMGDDDDNIDVTLPIPHAFFKSVLVERKSGLFDLWSFILPHEDTDESLESFRVKTTKVEKLSGLRLWETLLGASIMRKKNSIRSMWSLT